MIEKNYQNHLINKLFNKKIIIINHWPRVMISKTSDSKIKKKFIKVNKNLV